MENWFRGGDAKLRGGAEIRKVLEGDGEFLKVTQSCAEGQRFAKFLKVTESAALSLPNVLCGGAEIRKVF
ncbi:hypothetical protein DIT68_04085 [Brumimicrobium oceani]|uniref:Uncharacterized protein n=1 Tax=Brumimicrobium oceani TaxID=2100725 RepID=A0A2U2XF47_9FLAO|nr:hypothetical protein DIT68_04085 [Brumimicrobium oceani]